MKIAKSKQPEVVLGKLWQRNYWENIIRDADAYNQIKGYIVGNPGDWESDGFYSAD
ncbi:MAG: hypothetical protein ABMA02_19980 [Saprospiraceae bacterium]